VLNGENYSSLNGVIDHTFDSQQAGNYDVNNNNNNKRISINVT